MPVEGLTEWSRTHGPDLLTGWYRFRRGSLRPLVENWSSLDTLAFAAITGAPRIEYVDAVAVDFAQRRRNWHNVRPYCHKVSGSSIGSSRACGTFANP